MARIQAIDPSRATGKAGELLSAVHKKLGMTPNMMRTMAASPAVLQGYLELNAALAGGALDARVREQIALAVAEANRCDYCLAAHAALGKMAGLSESDISSARKAQATDTRTAAILRLSQSIAKQRGAIRDEDHGSALRAGLSEAEIAEVVANVALNVFTNFFNLVAQTEIDFPRSVPLAATANGTNR